MGWRGEKGLFKKNTGVVCPVRCFVRGDLKWRGGEDCEG